jgi:hypothetical protein
MMSMAWLSSVRTDGAFLGAAENVADGLVPFPLPFPFWCGGYDWLPLGAYSVVLCMVWLSS